MSLCVQFALVIALFMAYDASAATGPVAELRVSRRIASTSSTVFRAWTEPDMVRQWFPYHAKVHWTADPVANAKRGRRFQWSVASDSDVKEVFSFHGVYREVKFPKMLVFSWEWKSLPIPGVEQHGQTLVKIKLIAQGQNTIVVLTQSGFYTVEARTAHERGWNRCFDGIEQLLSTKQP